MNDTVEKGKKGFKVNPDQFIPELQLNRGFYKEIVKGLLDKNYPGLTYSASLIGHCSGCLGFDTLISADHGWGPRLQLFLNENDLARYKTELLEFFAYELPLKYKGFPTNQFQGCWGMEEIDSPPIKHWIEIETIKSFFNRDIVWASEASPTIHEWLSFTDQALCELTSGEVFHDELGELVQARKWIEFYPDIVWFFKMYCLWSAIAEEDAFIGRCNDLNDFVGEKLIAGKIIGKLMKLCFLLERKYYPYSKWFGTAFSRLDCGSNLMVLIENILTEGSFDERNSHLCKLYQGVGKMHNALGITAQVNTSIIDYHGRPYAGMDPEPFCIELKKGFGELLHAYDLELLSKTVLYDESNFGSYKREMKKLADFARIK